MTERYKLMEDIHNPANAHILDTVLDKEIPFEDKEAIMNLLNKQGEQIKQKDTQIDNLLSENRKYVFKLGKCSKKIVDLKNSKPSQYIQGKINLLGGLAIKSNEIIFHLSRGVSEDGSTAGDKEILDLVNDMENYQFIDIDIEEKELERVVRVR